MPLQLYLHDCDKQIDIHIPAAETIIGRDSILQCDDKRISRQHGIIRLATEETGSIQITSTHSNPIFIRTEDSVLNILSKDLTATLRQGEKFALLPDQYWYEVKFRTEGDQETAISSSDNCPLRIRTMEEVNNAVVSSDAIADTVGKRKGCDESEAESSKKLRTEQSDTGAEANCSDADAPVVKPEPNTEETGEASSSRPKSPATSVPVKIEIKTEVADSTGPPPRPSCEFGIRCYRHTADHRAQFAHPNDNDYRRPTFPAAPDDAPHCPFGASCYRRNPMHFREYQHPDSTSVAPVHQAHVPLMQIQSNQSNNSNDDSGQRRQRNRRFARDIVMAAIMNPGLFDGSDEDEDQDVDLFDYDSDSDEFRPERESNEEDDDEADTEDFLEDEE
ncbi:aprataxin and PNK-like factor isoform X2 [Toxorhynchites rutilus septentrionalis]|uniref:aprataxin and PNK-like factor isoform X2 n=1 Tax=Toxorhynchites rutilus septentrionalis TaxID=329112 RepID=UPI0024788AC5|nr:aprataxin and PNK-like factor isoform X2 [Toxorhynchites rutilus septentrionalis]